jgi:hypothetical protein
VPALSKASSKASSKALKPQAKRHFPAPDYIVQDCAMQGMAANCVSLIIKAGRLVQIRPRIEKL